MPVKQLPQRHVVTASQAHDQLVVVHHLVYCTRRAAGSRPGFGPHRLKDSSHGRAPLFAL
jgi:hypothetical protein